MLDLYTREIVALGQPLGWAMAPRMTQQLVIDALRKAWFRKHPGKHAAMAGLGPLVFHADRGSQYASLSFRKVLKGYGMVQSRGWPRAMSGTGDCFDNASMESFWHSLKVEEVHGHNYATREEATRAIATYIEVFYIGFNELRTDQPYLMIELHQFPAPVASLQRLPLEMSAAAGFHGNHAG